MGNWESFFSTEATAAAALMGLIFVGVSINLQRMIELPKLPDRALLVLVLLISIIIVASLQLVPALPLQVRGAIILVSGFCAWIVALMLDRRIVRRTPKKYVKTAVFNVMLTQFSLLPYLLAGALLLADNVAGLYCLIVAFTCSFIKALMDAWVLLIEINR